MKFNLTNKFIFNVGTNQKKQIEGIFEIIGTPDDLSWPGFKYDLECCSLDIPDFPGRDLKSLAPRLEENGLDLLRKFLKCNPLSRISSSEALLHQYFSPLPQEVHNLNDVQSIYSISSIKPVPEKSSTRPNYVAV